MSDAPDFIPYGKDGSGHAGNDTSRERQEANDASGVTAKNQRYALNLLRYSGEAGMTAAEFEDAAVIGHGMASSALSHLHRAGHVRRIKERRKRHEVYVLPEYVNGREESPYRPRLGRDLSDVRQLDKSTLWREGYEAAIKAVLDHKYMGGKLPTERVQELDPYKES